MIMPVVLTPVSTKFVLFGVLSVHMSFDFGLKTMTQASANGVGPLCTFIQTIETSLPWREHSYQLSIFLTEILWWNSQIAILDATKHIRFADLYDVPGFPTLILFEHGVPVARHKGARDIESLLAFLESNLSGK
jgi:hypothetical protein